MFNSSSSNYDLIYEGIGEIPRLDYNRAMLLLPPQPNAQQLKLDQIIERRLSRSEQGSIYLKMKVQPSDVNGIIVRNQFSNAEDLSWYYLNEIVKGIYEYLVLGIRWGEIPHSVPYTGVEIILMDAEMSWDIKQWWITTVTKIAFKEVLDPVEGQMGTES